MENMDSAIFICQIKFQKIPHSLLLFTGGWAGLDKYSFSGVAAFLCELGFAVYNIHYRRGCFYCSEKVSSLKKVGDYRKLLTAPCCSEIISN